MLSQITAVIITFLFLAFTSCKAGKDKSNVSLSKDGMDTMKMDNGKPWEKDFGIDELSVKYVDKELLLYLNEKHANWSLPDQFKWYPQLFAKYKTDSTLVGCITGDFDCNGLKDYALIIEKENGKSALVSFLKADDSFKTVELSDINKAWESKGSTAVSDRDKYEIKLALYKPGRYNITDPDLGPSDTTYVNLKCNAIGITPFKELYEAESVLFYWENKELKSCIIKN